MALLATHPFLETSVGFLEQSDALSDLREHGRLIDTYLHAEDGNVALIGEIDLNAGTVFTVAYGFGLGPPETAQPILLADLMVQEGALSSAEQKRFWPMVLNAAQFLVQYGPATELDRWEEKEGFNAYTLSTMIAALLTAAEWADTMGESALAIGLRELADSWNERIEGWMYVRGTSLAARLGVDGYYARILSSERIFPPAPGDNEVTLLPKEHEEEEKGELPPEEVVAVDALSLARFGLRRPDDPRILNTVRAIDALLLTVTERGPVWRRYNGDRFGEHDDGKPFSTKDKGRGRAWPLLIGERAHYELLRGGAERAKELCRVMAQYATDTGLIPEQVWDADDVPTRELFRGKPTGSVCPLLWAHGEYVKLRRSIRDGRVFDAPRQTLKRYLAG